jgi:protein-L-isoaspartate(D-aspartate) O-methyltransferase
MIETQIRRRGVHDPRVLEAMSAVPRHAFVPAEVVERAYLDEPLPIGQGQTISQPYIVAAMTAALELDGRERVLEIGTGCGYQAAVLSRLAREVFTIERLPELAEGARKRLEELGFGAVRVFCRDGTMGLGEFAPFDAILVAAAAPAVPEPLVEQLAAGGRMILPVGTAKGQRLMHVSKRNSGVTVSTRETCRFVLLLGEHGWKDREQ